MSIVEAAMDAVIAMANETATFAAVHRGALSAAQDVCCELGPSGPESTFMTKDGVIVLDVVFNAKHSDLEAALDVLGNIHKALAKRRAYPSSAGWQMLNIQTPTFPRRIGREADNTWLTASALSVSIYDKEVTENA